MWNANFSFASGAPVLVAEPVLQYEAIGGSLISIPLQYGASTFQSNQIQPFTVDVAPLAFSVMQWSAVLSASVANIPITKTAVCCLVRFAIRK
jgi:hypothetical protein